MKMYHFKKGKHKLLKERNKNTHMNFLVSKKLMSIRREFCIDRCLSKSNANQRPMGATESKLFTYK